MTVAPLLPLPSPRPPRRLMSEQLRALGERFATRPARLGAVLAVLRGGGYRLLLILLCLPFLTPVPLPLLSTVFGSAIALIGFGFALGRRPRLPASVLRRALPEKFFAGLLRASVRIVAALEFFLKPRWQWLHRQEAVRRLRGVLVTLCGVMLLLPLPVPLSNFFPTAAALLLSASALEDDGLAFVLGLILFGASAAFFVFIAIGGSTAGWKLWQSLVN
jgi:hypothetical protein